MPATAIHALPYPTQVPAGPGPDVPADIKALADALETRLTPFSSGAGTPAGLAIPAGKPGRRHLNTATGDLYLDIGAAWVLEFDYEADAGNGIDIVGRSVAVKLLGTGGGSGLSFSAGSLLVNSDEVTVERAAGLLQVKDAAINAAKVAASLKPSGGAAAATEALRALGVVAGTAAAGNDSRIVNALDKTLLDVKGDLIVASAADTPARVAVGTDGLFLKADSAAGNGVSWATPHVADLYANRPAAAAALNGLRFFATDKMMQWQCIAAAWVLVSVFAPEVSSLPAGPIDQQECIYVASTTGGIKWHLRYRSASASAYKWEPVNDAAWLVSTVDTSESVNSAPFANATTLGPDVTTPLAGDWETEFEAQSVSGAAGIVNTVIGINVAGVAPTGNKQGVVTMNAVNHQAIPYKSVALSALAASTLIRLQYASAPAQIMTFLYRRLRVRPVRVG